MFIRNLKDCPKIIAGDNSVLRESRISHSLIITSEVTLDSSEVEKLSPDSSTIRGVRTHTSEVFLSLCEIRENYLIPSKTI